MIEKGKACLTPTNKPFWKYPEDVPSCIRTRSQEKNQKNVKIRDTINTLNKKIFRDG